MTQKSVDGATLEMLKVAKDQNLETVWDRWEKQQPQCGFGQLGVCCQICNMGPCRIDPFGGELRRGACGADADTIVARNLVAHDRRGTAAHSDHGRDVVHTLHLAAEGQGGYAIKDPFKLRTLAAEFGIKTDGKSDRGRRQGGRGLRRADVRPAGGRTPLDRPRAGQAAASCGASSASSRAASTARSSR